LGERHFEVLPAAQENRDRTLDLTVTAPRDVIAPDGNLIIRAGQRVNPLDKLAFGLCLIVFDATEKAQIDAVRHLSCRDKTARVLYLATELPQEDGWESLKTLETTLNAPVYLLTSDVRQRFQLQKAPALVEQSGNRVLVRERKVTILLRPENIDEMVDCAMAVLGANKSGYRRSCRYDQQSH